MTESNYRRCTKSIMDNISDPDIVFDDNGISNYCYEYEDKAKSRLFNDTKNSEQFTAIIKRIKKAGAGKDYDCLIGISGGVDSTYLALKVKELGLNPLAVHFDNGWNSELAVKNIENTLNQLQIDLVTYVINWEEFRSLQVAFLAASTPDGEIPTDHAIFAVLFQMAAQHNIKYILNGNNFATESIMPPTWSYGHIDWLYINYINSQFGSSTLKTYPRLTPIKYFYYTFLKGIRIISLLNYMQYDKTKALELLKSRLDWKYYGGKHYESIYTRFYQGYILPEKFKIDKRKAHLSTLVLSGQLTRDEALTELETPPYPKDLLEEDTEFVLKKLSLSRSEFENIMRLPTKTFRDYPNQSVKLNSLRKILNQLRKKKIFYS